MVAQVVCGLTALVCMLVVTMPTDADAKRRVRAKSAASASVSGVNSGSKYADIIMNPATGEIYHQTDADALRYPASLTKMMTLYLLFEALERNKIDLDDSMRVSAYAASMPQTNLSLKPGDRIDVETAIKSQVVRSANDVSVVIAEELGGDVASFARMMTAKARKLGMRKTIFKNPNGLPNGGQVTTARDMAKLGIALKRDFPRYYRYFSTLQFSYRGVTYYTHNRVLLRYAGVDGIKTGYIGSAGSGRARDDRMIELLDEAYDKIAARGSSRGKLYPSNLPMTKDGNAKGRGTPMRGLDADDLESKPTSKPVPVPTPKPLPDASIPEPTEMEDGGLDADILPPAVMPQSAEVSASTAAVLAAPTVPAASAPAQETMVTSDPAPAAAAEASPFAVAQPPAAPATPQAAYQPAPGSATAAAPARQFETVNESPQYAPAVANTPFAVADRASPAPVQLARPSTEGNDFGWGIQVGAFSSREQAEQAVNTASKTVPRALVGSRSAVINPQPGGAAVYRARIEHLSQIQARRACEELVSRNSPCFIYKVAQ
jgi:D-alanyl-D-alanine carboxypeptidase